MGLTVTITGTPVVGNTLTAFAVETPVPPGPGGPRFYQGFPWRFIFTDLTTTTTTWASGIQSERRVTHTLGESTVIEGAVDPDDFRVNGIWTDGYPRVAQSNRLVYCFRREGGDGFGSPAWVVRAAGILMAPNDEGDADSVLSHYVAYDPRKLLEAKPCLDANGSLPGPDGFRFLSATTGFARGNEIIGLLLSNSIFYDGPCHIDAGTAYGGTSFYGTSGASIDPTAPCDIVIQNGMSVADAWAAVESTGTCEIRLNPIYDPVNRPGYTHELAIHKQVGIVRYDVVMGWDVLNHALNKISRMHSAVPGDFFNVVDYFAGQGGPASAIAAGPLVNAASVADFGRYWSMQFFPSMQSSVSPAAAIYTLAQQALELAKQGKRTLTLGTVSDRAKVPLRDYREGDRIGVWASKRLRVRTSSGANGRQRVQAIPLEISDDGVETLSALIVSPDYLNLDPTSIPGFSTIRTSFAQSPSSMSLQRVTMVPQRLAPTTLQPMRNTRVVSPTTSGVAVRTSRRVHIVSLSPTTSLRGRR